MYIFYFLMLFIITPWIYVKGMPYNYGIYYYPKELFMVFFTFVVFIYLIYKHKKKELKIDKLYMSLFLILFAIFTIGHRYSSTPFFSGRTIGGFFIFIVTFIYFYNFKNKKLIVYFLWGVGIIQGIIGITQKMGIYYNITGIINMKDRLTFSGSFGNVNMVSHFMGAVFLICTYYIFVEKNLLRKNIIIAGNIFIFYMILVTQTRGTMLAVLIGLFLLFIRYYKNRLKKEKKSIIKMGVGMLLAIIIFVNFELTDRALKNRLAEEEGLNSTVERILIWRETIELIREKPILGHGTGSFIIEEQKIFKNLIRENGYIELKNKNVIVAHAHNDYFQTFAENGVFGFIAVIAIVGVTILKFAKSKKYSSGIFFVGVLSYMVTAFFEFPLHMIHNGVIAFAFLGIFASTIIEKHRYS